MINKFAMPATGIINRFLKMGWHIVNTWFIVIFCRYFAPPPVF